MSYSIVGVDSCSICGEEYQVLLQQRSHGEAVQHTTHLCYGSHVVTWNYGEKSQARLNVEGAAIPVYLEGDHESLALTLQEVDKLTQSGIEALKAAFRVKTSEHASPADVIKIIKGHVQAEWYVATKGAIPMSNQKNNEARAEKAAKAPGVEGTAATKKAPKAPHPVKTYKVAAGKKEEVDKLKGQAAQVVSVLKQMGKGDAKSIGTQLALLPDFKTRQTPERVAGYYLKQLSDSGLLESVS